MTQQQPELEPQDFSNHNKPKKGPGLKAKVVLALVFAALGYGLAKVANPVDEQAVRESMYKACVNGPNYAPSELPAQGINCNRESIDRELAIVYGHSHVPPVIPTDPRYESEILRFKR